MSSSTRVFDDHLFQFKGQTVLCIGDLMLDEFHYGAVERISPEAATPVIAVERCETMVGGAGNVARNIAGLGASCALVGVRGDDEAGRVLMQRFAGDPNIEMLLVVDPLRPTTRKMRFVSERHSTHLLRADWEKSTRIDPDDFVDRFAAALLEKRIDRGAEKRATRENGRDVLEDDSRFRKIRHVAHGGAQFLKRIGSHGGDASGSLGNVNGGSVPGFIGARH